MLVFQLFYLRSRGQGYYHAGKALDLKSGLTSPTSVLVTASLCLSHLRSARPEAELGSFCLWFIEALTQLLESYKLGLFCQPLAATFPLRTVIPRHLTSHLPSHFHSHCHFGLCHCPSFLTLDLFLAQQIHLPSSGSLWDQMVSAGGP